MRNPDPTTEHATPQHLAEGGAVAMLVVVGGPSRGDVFELAIDEPQTLGRSDEASIVLPHRGISRVHARVVVTPAYQLEVADCGSKNGTFVSANAFEGTPLLAHHGEAIAIGEDTRLQFRVVPGPEVGRVRTAIAAVQSLRQLSEREREVAEAVAEGASSARIAKRLGVSPRTITTHLSNIYERLGLSGRAALTRYVVQNGLD